MKIRVLAVTSGVVGLLAGGFLIGFFALEPSGVRLGGVSLGTINDVLGAAQFATLAPVAWALGRRLPATRPVRTTTVVAVVAMAAFVVLSVLLVAGVLTFAAQIGPVVAAIIAVYGWLLTVNLVGHRTHTLPRVVTRTGMLLATALLLALVLIATSYALPALVAPVLRSIGYGLGTLAWLGLPAYVLLLAARVFAPPATPAPSTTPLREGVRS